MKAECSGGFRLFGVFTLVWTGLWCGDLLAAWRHAPYDRTGAVAMALWVAAATMASRPFQPARAWLAAAWVGSLLGVAGSLHVAQHAALVCAAVAWLPTAGWRIAIAVTALSWMPVFGWALAGFSPTTVNTGRVLLATAALGAAVWSRSRQSPIPA